MLCPKRLWKIDKNYERLFSFFSRSHKIDGAGGVAGGGCGGGDDSGDGDSNDDSSGTVVVVVV